MTEGYWVIANIDDQDAIRYAKTRVLRRAGFEVVEATSGYAALEVIEKHRPALVLSDIKMPDMSGLELCEIIKERFPGTLVLQISATFVTALDRAKGLNHGADSYLTEPVSPEELLASVRALLRLKEYENSLRREHDRREFIHRLAEQQRSIESPEEIMRVVVEQLGRKLGAARTRFINIHDAELPALLAGWTDADTPTSLGGGSETAFDEAVLERYRAGQTVVGGSGNGATSDGGDAWLGVPLLRRGRLEALLLIDATPDRTWAPDETALVEEVGQLTWDAVERARAHAELRKLNETLEERIDSGTQELNRAQEQLRQAQKMEALGQLTGGIAHDFNNLLTGIIGGIDAARRRIAKSQMDGANRFMDEIVASAHRAASLINRLLAFSRQQALDIQPLNVNDMVESLAELMRRTLGENIELHIEPAGDLWAARTDVNQLESALLNLVINARDAMPEGGTLTVTTANHRVDRPNTATTLEPGDYIVLSVADTGSGMPKEIIDRAFDPFFTTKPIGHGTGLGLSMVYGFAKQAHGDATIESETGKGTTVRIYMPRSVEGTRTRTTPAAVRSVSKGGATILVVEDNLTVRLMLLELLEDMGHAVVVAGDGPEGVQILSSERRFDLLISDIGLPGMNGGQVAEIGRRCWPGLKVLFITGYGEGQRNAANVPPDADIIRKPFDPNVLAQKVDEMLQRE